MVKEAQYRSNQNIVKGRYVIINAVQSDLVKLIEPVAFQYIQCIQQ